MLWVLGQANVPKRFDKIGFGLSIWYVRFLWPIFQLPSPWTRLYTFFITHPRPFPQLRMYLMDRIFLNQKTTTFEYRIRWNKTFEKKFFKRIYQSKDIALDQSHVISH